MSAIDWKPGPQLRAAMDVDKALAHMQRDNLGGYGLTVRRFGARKLFAAGTTAQEAADAMEILISAQCDTEAFEKASGIKFNTGGKIVIGTETICSVDSMERIIGGEG